MIPDEILSEYEDIWRKAALEGRPQYSPVSASAASESLPCAMNIGGARLLIAVIETPVQWRCPECFFRARKLSMVGIHLNDDHDWTWLDFANKFRDVLAQGSR